MTQDSQTPHRFLTPALLTEMLQSAGYRVTEGKGPDGAPVLLSATNGLSFEVRLFNPLTPGGFADAAFRAAFRVEGDLPLALVNTWNVTHRFARLGLATIAGDAPNTWLLLEMDVIGLGGVPADNLRAHVEVWDRLVPELIAYLRAELPKLARPAPIAEPAAAPQPSSEIAAPDATA